MSAIWRILIEGGVGQLNAEAWQPNAAQQNPEAGQDQGQQNPEADRNQQNTVLLQLLAHETQQFVEATQLERQQHYEEMQIMQGQLREAEARAQTAEARARTAEQALEQALECAVCLSRPKCFMMVPCSHLCACAECAPGLMNGECPICRAVVTYTTRVYI